MLSIYEKLDYVQECVAVVNYLILFSISCENTVPFNIGIAWITTWSTFLMVPCCPQEDSFRLFFFDIWNHCSVYGNTGSMYDFLFIIKINTFRCGSRIWSRAPGPEAESCRCSEAELRERSEQFVAGIQEGPWKLFGFLSWDDRIS